MSRKLKTSITPDPRYHYGCYLLSLRSYTASIFENFLNIFVGYVWAIIGVKVFWDHPFFSATGSRSHFYNSALESSRPILQNICWGRGHGGQAFCATGADILTFFFGGKLGELISGEPASRSSSNLAVL